MRGKFNLGVLFVSTLMVLVHAGTAHAVWDTVVEELIDDQTTLDELADLGDEVTALDLTVLTTAEKAIAVKTLIPNSVTSSITAGEKASGVATAKVTLGRVAALRGEALYARLLNAPVGPAGPSSHVNVLGSPGVWGKAMSTNGDQDSMGGVDGYEFNTTGVMFGYDWLSCRNWLVGIDFGMLNSDVQSGYNLTANTGIDSWAASMYGTYSRGLDYLDFGFSYVMGDVVSSRKVIISSVTYTVVGDTDSTTSLAYAYMGRNNVFNRRHVFTPFVGAQWSSTTIAAYTETGTGALQYEENKTDLFNTNLGFKYEYVASSQARLKARLAWSHEWSSDLPTVTSSRFTALDPTTASYFQTEGIDADANRLGIGLGFRVNMSENVNLDLDYDYEKAKGYASHSGLLSFKVRY